MAGDPGKRIAHAVKQGRDYVPHGEIAESSAHVVPLAEQKLASAVSLIAEGARMLIEDGLPPEEAVDPKWAAISPELASRGLLTERGRLLSAAKQCQDLAARIVSMLDDQDGGEG